MPDEAHIHDSIQKVVGALRQHPEAGLDMNAATGRLEDGLKCTVRQGGFSATMDMGDSLGGEGLDPSPGFFGRASIIGCVAIGIKLTAARKQVPIIAIDVDIETDWDNRGLFGLDGVSAGCQDMRLKIAVQSPADEKVVRAVIAEGLENDPWLITFTQAQSCTTDISVHA